MEYTYPRLIELMIGSPAGVTEERLLVEHQVSKWNTENARTMRSVYVTHRWETSPTPVVGEGSGQDRIDADVLDRCQVLIALFADRIGTPHSGYAGGTEYEIERAIKNGIRTHVIFVKLPKAIDEIDLKQLAGLRDFEKRMSTRGLLSEVTSTAELEDVVRRILTSDAETFESRAQESVSGIGTDLLRVALDTTSINGSSILITNEGAGVLSDFDLTEVSINGRQTTVLNAGAVYPLRPGSTLRYPLTEALLPNAEVLTKFRWKDGGRIQHLTVALRVSGPR